MLCPGRSNLLSPVFYRTLLEQGFAGRSPSFASRSGVLSPPARARVLRLKGWYCIWRDLWIYSIHVGTPNSYQQPAQQIHVSGPFFFIRLCHRLVQHQVHLIDFRAR